MEIKIENLYQLTLFKAFKYANIMVVENNPQILILVSTKQYIPIEQFKEIFDEIGQIIKEKNINKLIFDKRTLKVFHQPSMEWYFHWKEEMFDFGLKIYRKILPDDDVFCHSVKIAREKISADHQKGNLQFMSIEYSKDIKEAIES